MLKYLGLLMIASAGILISREYEKKEKKRLFELSEFIRLLEHVRLKISSFLSPKSDWLSSFSAESSPISEFLGFAEAHSLSESFDFVKDKLSLGAERDTLARLFATLGKTYKDGEIELLDEGIAELNERREKLSEECEKNIKTVKVLVAAISLGLIILFL